MSLTALPLFVNMRGRPVILLGDGDAAAAKRRLLDRAAARIVGEDDHAALAIVAIDDAAAAEAAIARLKRRGILVNAVDRPEHCDFTLPAIVDRSPVIVAIGTGGVSAGLAAALRQRLEAILPASLGSLAQALQAARPRLRDVWPDAAERRRALANALGEGGAIDPLGADPDVAFWLDEDPRDQVVDEVRVIRLTSRDPDQLTLGDARALAGADRVYHADDAPSAILDRARADALRLPFPAPAIAEAGLSVHLEMAR